MSALFPVFLKLQGRRVVVVGGGPVAASKLRALLDAGADVTVIAPGVIDEIAGSKVTIHRRAFAAADLDAAWFVVAAATPEVNRQVALAADARQVFVNAVDDVRNASAYLGGVVRRDGVTVAISTDGAAPAMAGLLREGLDALLPRDLGAWMDCARQTRRAWLAQRVPMEQRRPLLLRALNDLYGGADRRALRTQQPRGFVSLVGAGPGDPDLLTRRAVERLANADLVLYDALVDPRALCFAANAKRVFVGKRAGRPAVSQDFINRLLVRSARRGLQVVRLKGGDPFVFGRGGEEALALVAAGIPFEIVPGVSSAIAAPALSGIPVTHRSVASGFVVVSGHSPEAFVPVLSSLQPRVATIVVLMGLGNASTISALLVDRGWDRETPTAVIVSAATEQMTVRSGTLETLASDAGDADGPATIVIGDVVRLRGVLGASADPALKECATTTDRISSGAAL